MGTAPTTTDGTGAVPAVNIRLMQERRQGRHVQRTDVWAEFATWAHQRWIYRRDRSPWLYVIPLAVVAALLVR